MKIDESVIDKVLDNKAAPGEARKVAGWFVTEEGRKYLSGRLDREMEELAEEMPEDVRLPSIPGMKMKQRFMSEIKRERGRRSVGRKWMWVAAVLLPFVFLSVSLLFLVNRTGIFSETEYAEISVPYGEQMRVILQDGSIVHLNSDSRLRYPKQFGLFNRTVELWGEGYFNVARDENRPFKVDLQGVEVRVTGTRFNVKAYAAEPNIWVTLDEGGILFRDHNAKEYRLVPGESADIFQFWDCFCVKIEEYMSAGDSPMMMVLYLSPGIIKRNNLEVREKVWKVSEFQDKQYTVSTKVMDEQIFDEQVCIIDTQGTPISDLLYYIEYDGVKISSGRTDEKGMIPRIGGETFKKEFVIYLGEDALAKILD